MTNHIDGISMDSDLLFSLKKHMISYHHYELEVSFMLSVRLYKNDDREFLSFSCFQKCAMTTKPI
jgi:hypothetical protein